ncbi:hypothetical protein evm_006334 [Chilo suppressalis]|nr:hypothetical protein evm_006334 [Chilo suppressalis]
MTTTQIISIYISKLNHPLKEIRERSLKLLLTKIKLGWELEDELSCTRELIEALLKWFQYPSLSLHKEALDLFTTILKTKSGTYIAKEYGIGNLLSCLNKIKHHINDPEAIELFNSTIETMKFLNTVDSETDVSVPHLNLPSFINSEAEAGSNSGEYNITNNHTSKETSILNEDDESGDHLPSQVNGIKLFLFPWVDLNTSDSKTMLMVEDALTLLKSVRRCCRFICNVFLRDFPAEIFLNRPTIIKNLLAISEGNDGNQAEEALQVLLCLTKALYRSLMKLYSLDILHDSIKLTDEQMNGVCGIPIDLQQIINNDEVNISPSENNLMVLRQLPSPTYTLDTAHAVLTTMSRSIVVVDTVSKTEILNLKEINKCLDLLESLIKLLLACVDECFWREDHSTKTHRDIAHKSCMVMRLLGDLLDKYRSAFVNASEADYKWAVWLRLVVSAETLLKWAGNSALPPTTLVAALQVAQLDPALQILYPELSERITLALQISKSSVNQEYKTKYRELLKLTSSMDDAVKFMKNKHCRSTKAVLNIIKKSLSVLELHTSESYLNDVADVLLKKSKDFNMDDNDWNLARSIALHLMAHKAEWVCAKFYSETAEMVKYVLVGDELNQTENEKCLNLLCDVGILTEICCHGLSSKSKQLEMKASEIMLYLLRGRLALSEGTWWRLLASLLPVLPLLHVYAEHNTPLGKAICKSLETDIAACMGVPLAEVVSGLVRSLLVRCVGVQLDAAHALCRLLDDDRYLPPKEALRADVLINALKRVQPQDFNVDSSSSPSKNPQITGLLQILDVLKQDIILDEHGTEYVTRDSVQPTLEPSLRRSTLQQLAVLMRQQDCHEAFLQNDGLRVIVAVLRMSLMVDDYLAYPECAISCVSILNSVCFLSRHNLAKINDLPTLLLRVILVFPANDSAVLMSAQVLALTAWSGFVLQELDSDRKRVPALPHCVTLRISLPFIANSYWRSSPNAEHSSIEWLASSDEWRASLRVRWWCAYESFERVLKGAPPPPAPLSLQPTNHDRVLLRAACPQHSAASALLALENATSHSQVIEALCLLESYVHLLPLSTAGGEFAALPWQHMKRFLRAPPASSRDTALLIALMHFIIVYMDCTLCTDGIATWIKSSFIDGDMTVIALLSRDQLLPQQTAQESIEVTQLHIHIVKVIQRCVKRLQHEDYDTGKLESLLKIMLSCLERIDLKNFHALGYLNELMLCIRNVLHSRYCKLSENTFVFAMRVVTNTLSGCASGAGRKGQACRLDAILSLLAILRQAHGEKIPVQRWSELWHSDVVLAVFASSRGHCAELRAASLSTIATLAHYPQLLPHLLQATVESSLAQYAAQIFAETREANVVRAAAADLLTAVAARASPHCDVLESHVIEQLQSHSVVEHCLEILVRFCKERSYESTFEPNVPLSVLERRSELEVRAQKCGDVHVSPAPTSMRARPPPSPALVAGVADLLHNVCGFARFPVQLWNERGVYRLLFRCASLPIGSPLDIQRVRAAACRTLNAVTSHKCVRAILAATKDCLHNLVDTLTPLQEEEMYAEHIEARAQSLFLLASLLVDRSAAESLWTQLRGNQMTAFFCCLLQGLEADQTELRTAALYCLSQLTQSLHKTHQEKSTDNSWLPYFDSVKSPYTSSAFTSRSGAGDWNDRDCQPEYMVEEMCKMLMTLYRKIDLVTMNYQCSQDEFWPRVCSCLSSVLAVSPRGRAYTIHREFPKILLGSLQGVRDHLSVLGKPLDVIRNANHNPTMRVLYWLLTVINCCMVDCTPAKECFADGGIATSLNRLWPWCMTTEQLRNTTLTLLFNFTNECEKGIIL